MPTEFSSLFVSDLHGQVDRFQKLFHAIEAEQPRLVFIGGDIMPGLSQVRSLDFAHQDFIFDFLAPELRKLRSVLGEPYPRIFIILGNDDGRFPEPSILGVAGEGLWTYSHDRRVKVGIYTIYGYAYVPPTPFQLKDWERYDVSRYTDPGCISPEEGVLTIPMSQDERRYSTIGDDLEKFTGNDDLSKAVFLFHAPPHKTRLDRAALDGKMIDHVPLDVHVGSIAIRRFIEDRQPLVTLHGHVHESTELTGSWQDRLGKTLMFNAAHKGPELALIRFDLDDPTQASRELI
ncbi:MAG: metallophosphoesterase [bacterium]|nr:metallophosphoesterase [bacterium]